MLQRGSFFLFSLERYDRELKAVRVVGGAIIAAENPMYVGRQLVGTDAVDDMSELVVGTNHGQQVIDELERLGAKPGTEVTREYENMYPLFEEMTQRSTTVVFSRGGNRASFVRKTDRYESILREFVAEHEARQR